MVWLSLPSVERTPHTIAAFAKELGVGEKTLYRWKLLPGFQDEVKALIKSNLGDALHDVVHSFKAEARKGSFQHQKMYFEMMGLHTDKVDGELAIRVIHVTQDEQPQPHD